MTFSVMKSGHNTLSYFRPAKIVFASANGCPKSSAAIAWRNLRKWMKDHGLKIEEVALGFGLLHNSSDDGNVRFDACIDIAYQGKPPDNRLPTSTLAGGVYIASNPLDSHANLKCASYSVEHNPLVGGQSLTIDYERPAIVTYNLEPNSAWKLTLNRPVRLNDSQAA